MEEEQYPALYRASDKASLRAQNRYLWSVRMYSFLLIGAAGASVYGLQDTKAAIIAGLLIIGSIIITILMVLQKDEDSWYRARAVAESVKTSAWRFMMRADPFLDADDVRTVKGYFRDRLRNILNEHKDLAHELGGELASEEQITEEMCKVRSLPLLDRIDFYRKHRIDDQRRWYAKKSSYNKRRGKLWFGILLAAQVIAIILVVLRVGYPTWSYWPTEVFVVSAGAALTWIQVKRFRELAAAYGLTAHELGMIRNDLESIQNESEFAQFVVDSESAFSREHTQWLARKDVV